MIIIVTLSVHIEKALPDDLGRAFLCRCMVDMLNL